MNSFHSRLAIYTCITGDYDALVAPACIEDDADYFCFTDRPGSPTCGWTLRPLPVRFRDPVSANRYVKMHPHRLFPDHAASLYLDGNIHIRAPVRAFVDQALGQGGLALFEHPFRDCLYDEAREIAALGYDWYWRIFRQTRRYAREGFPAHYGMFEANVLLRRHHDPQVIRTMEQWWGEFRPGVRRDQLSLSYVLWKSGLPVVNLGRSDPRFAQTLFWSTFRHTQALPKKRELLGRFNCRAQRMNLWPQA